MPDELVIADEEKKEQPRLVEDMLKESYKFEQEEKELSSNKCEKNAAKKSKPCLVIVEDDIEIQQYLVQELKSSFRISTYDNGQEALTGYTRHRVE